VSIELIKAIGEYIVLPICIFAAIYFSTKD